MQIDNLKDLEAIIKLLSKHQLECLEIGDIKITKSKHLGKAIPQKKQVESPVNLDIDEDDHLMFASTSAPKMALEDFSLFSANLPPDQNG
jgi:hypothetical protein